MRHALVLFGLVLAAWAAAAPNAGARDVAGWDVAGGSVGAADGTTLGIPAPGIPAPGIPAPGIAGTWFGERWTGALLIQHLSQRAPDGSLQVRFRFLQGCAVVGGEAQEGRWLREGDAFHAWIERVDGGPARPDGSAILFSYGIDALSEDRITYRHIPSDRVHRAFRVPAGYRMPPPLGCAATS